MSATMEQQFASLTTVASPDLQLPYHPLDPLTAAE